MLVFLAGVGRFSYLDLGFLAISFTLYSIMELSCFMLLKFTAVRLPPFSLTFETLLIVVEHRFAPAFVRLAADMLRLSLMDF